jgi:hypothetical protein
VLRACVAALDAPDSGIVELAADCSSGANSRDCGTADYAAGLESQALVRGRCDKKIELWNVESSPRRVLQNSKKPGSAAAPIRLANPSPPEDSAARFPGQSPLLVTPARREID